MYGDWITIFPHIISGSSTCCDSLNIMKTDPKGHINPNLLGVYDFDGNDPDGNRVYRKDYRISGPFEDDSGPRYISRSLLLNTWQV